MTTSGNKRLWGGAFSAGALPLLEEFSNSIQFDWKLADYDIQGSIAHVTMLGECGILPKEEAATIVAGLSKLRTKLQEGTLEFSLADEDIHMNIERLLHAEIGPVAGKLHTARSRNDQVALDMHLFVREKCDTIIALLKGLQRALVEMSEKHLTVIMPGYTHLQRAQPVLFSHHLLAYFWMLQRDLSRFSDCRKRANYSPLGSGALAGTTFPISRERVAELLNFDGVYENSMDGVSDRDFVVEFLSASALTMTHLSRLCEEIVLWTSGEFKFISLHDSYCTGSSIMPQKKNADPAELIRGKTGRVTGALLSLLMTLKGLPLAYNKDMQEDKEGLFDTVTTLTGALEILAGLISTMTVREDTMKVAAAADFSNATDLADYLAARGLPFREAHEIAAKLVAECMRRGTTLEALPLEELKTYSKLFESDVFDALKVTSVVGRRDSRGGTSPKAVKFQLTLAKTQLNLVHETN
jgi:argininosuccinate lyase